MGSRTEQIREMQSKCDLAADLCESALAQSEGDVDRAIATLIELGRLTTAELDPDSASDASFEQAARREALAKYAKTIDEARHPKKSASLADLMGASGSAFAKEAETVLPGASALLSKLAAQREELLEKSRIAYAKQFEDQTPEKMLAAEEKKLAARASVSTDEEGPNKAARVPRTLGEQARRKRKIDKRSAYLKKHPFTLDLPPLPPLSRHMHEWEGTDTFAAWKGIAARATVDADDEADDESDSDSSTEVNITIPRLGDDDANPRPPAPEQIASYGLLKNEGEQVVANVFAAVLRDYHKLQKMWLKQQPDLELPVIETVEELRDHIGLSSVFVHPVAKDGFGYLGLALHCTWDEEHGAAVVLHGTRIVATGQGDLAFNYWTGQKDGGDELR